MIDTEEGGGGGVSGVGGSTVYMVHRKAQFHVTELVRAQLRVSDQSVAQLRGNVVDGIKPGRTEIQVGV